MKRWGTLKKWDGKSGFGYIRPEGSGTDVFCPIRNLRGYNVSKDRFEEPLDRKSIEKTLKEGAVIIFTSNPNNEALSWAVVNIEDEDEEPTTPTPVSIWDQIPDMIDGSRPLLLGLQQAHSVLKLSDEQLLIFAANTPNGMRGQELWDEFRRRQAIIDSDDYTFVEFVSVVLAEAIVPSIIG